MARDLHFIAEWNDADTVLVLTKYSRVPKISYDTSQHHPSSIVTEEASKQQHV